MTGLSAALLAAECTSDPAGLGLGAPFAAGQDATVAALLNAGVGGVGGGPSGAVLLRGSVPTAEAVMLVALSDWEGLSAAQQAYLTAVAATGSLLLVNPLALAAAAPPVYSELAAIATPLYANLVALFASTSPTGAALATTATRPCSRAEYLWGEGTVVAQSDVSAARGMGA